MTAHLAPVEQVERTPGDTFTEIMAAITGAITNHPRSLQKKIGPSEIGAPCARRLAYKLLGTPERPQQPNWPATVGTAVHGWMETVFDADNLTEHGNLGGQERWLVETRVNVGTVGGVDVTGSSDLFDRLTGSNWDWKVVSPTQLRKYRLQGPGQKYRVQAHLYGRGFWRAGIPCRSVNIVFLPRHGSLDETVHWSEPYDEQVALDALQRLEGIHLATTLAGTAALAGLPTADDWCSSCPFFRANSTDLATGCPGDPGAAANADSAPQLAGLIG